MTPDEKKKLFDQNQNNFIFKKDIIAGVVRTEVGPKMVLNIEKRNELTQCLGELQVAIIRETIKADGISAMSKPKGMFGGRF